MYLDSVVEIMSSVPVVSTNSINTSNLVNNGVAKLNVLDHMSLSFVLFLPHLTPKEPQEHSHNS
jgi:hypothetical protein